MRSPHQEKLKVIRVDPIEVYYSPEFNDWFCKNEKAPLSHDLLWSKFALGIVSKFFRERSEGRLEFVYSSTRGEEYVDFENCDYYVCDERGNLSNQGFRNVLDLCGISKTKEDVETISEYNYIGRS